MRRRRAGELREESARALPRAARAHARAARVRLAPRPAERRARARRRTSNVSSRRWSRRAATRGDGESPADVDRGVRRRGAATRSSETLRAFASERFGETAGASRARGRADAISRAAAWTRFDALGERRDSGRARPSTICGLWRAWAAPASRRRSRPRIACGSRSTPRSTRRRCEAVIVGLGIDAVDIARVERMFADKRERMLKRLFTADELEYPRGQGVARRSTSRFASPPRRQRTRRSPGTSSRAASVGATSRCSRGDDGRRSCASTGGRRRASTSSAAATIHVSLTHSGHGGRRRNRRALRAVALTIGLHCARRIPIYSLGNEPQSQARPRRRRASRLRWHCRARARGAGAAPVQRVANIVSVAVEEYGKGVDEKGRLISRGRVPGSRRLSRGRARRGVAPARRPRCADAARCSIRSLPRSRRKSRPRCSLR